MGMHSIDGAAVSKIQGAVLHFKYMSDFNTRVIEEVKREQHYNNAMVYKKYANSIHQNNELNFFNSKSMKFMDSKQLVRLNIMNTNKDFNDFVNSIP